MHEWLSQQIASIPFAAVILLGLCLVLSAGGFYRTVYFISIGYGLSIAGMAVANVILFHANHSWLTLLQAVLLFIYGARLGTYLMVREFNAGFRKYMEASPYSSREPNAVIKILIWITVALLYVLMVSPNLFAWQKQLAFSASSTLLLQIIGCAVMIGGLLLEGIADMQKSIFKKSEPKRFCDKGLYSIVRCPNYLGEMIVWTGNFIAGIGFYTTPLRFIIALTGYVCIVLIMLGSTRRLELSQDKRYGSNKEYQAYCKRVPIVLPIVPLFSLKKLKVYLG
ncbi:MAG: DUF1295 domain-containing protein [Spirochaetes bacterium]|nr:DUF1295 domain-containing protein [Spirochaetota bacterium]